MTLDQARNWAEQIAGELRGFCERIEPAGSIRRQRPECRDIDLVALPKAGLLPKIVARCKRNAAAIAQDGEQNLLFTLRNGVTVDVFFARPQDVDLAGANPCTWGTVLLCRTGSKRFNMWYAARAAARGLHWNPYHGLYMSSQCVAADSEEEMFRVAGLEWIAPEDRER